MGNGLASAGMRRPGRAMARRGCAALPGRGRMQASSATGVFPMRAALMLALVPLTLAACSPQDMADKIGRRTAETVVRPIVDNRLTGPQADAATRCVVQNASAAEVQSLARDVGVYAGTSTEAVVWAIVARSETQSCLAAAGVALGA
ncbi:hypothetical protein [Paragemmobacter kunshanensis]|nr:hypothetical protein [Rhodobacter kunshanensis]